MVLPDVDALVVDRNWASHPAVKEDVTGESAYWRQSQMKCPTYDTKLFIDLCRHLRNKLLHFGQLDRKLQEVFAKSAHGLLAFCNGQVKGGDLVFALWVADRKRVGVNRDPWAW